jgi:hypothetical protein
LSGGGPLDDCVLVSTAAARGCTPADQLFRPTNGSAAPAHRTSPALPSACRVWRLQGVMHTHRRKGDYVKYNANLGPSWLAALDWVEQQPSFDI